MNSFTIGILGGSGPGASAFFHTKLIQFAQEKYSAVQDIDFPHILHYSIGLNGFDETGIVDTEKVKRQLFDALRFLEKSGCNVIVIPCNTLHLFIEEMRDVITIPILSIIEETVKRACKLTPKKVGFIASQSTIQTGLYARELERYQFSYVGPLMGEFRAVTKLILEVMANCVAQESKNGVLNTLTRMQQDGANVVILGCTELPLAISKNDHDVSLVSSIDALALAVLDFWRQTQ